MLKIQVLGSGLIPRGLGLAPRKEFFPADRTTIATILQAREGFKVNYIHPETKKIKEITRKNLQEVWDRWGNYVPPKAETPVVPEEPEKEPENPDTSNGEDNTGDAEDDSTTEDTTEDNQETETDEAETPVEDHGNDSPTSVTKYQLGLGDEGHEENSTPVADEIPVRTVEETKEADQKVDAENDMIVPKVVPQAQTAKQYQGKGNEHHSNSKKNKR